ncbi:MAG: DUF6252 family protein [Bacteroidia bacterium]|nr:DUF6252 family protein [Bacteroidia bacterium]
MKKHLNSKLAIVVNYKVLLLFIFFLSYGCNKIDFNKNNEEINSNKLPEVSQEGKNVFACYVNGSSWIANGNFYEPAESIGVNDVFVHFNALKYIKDTEYSSHICWDIVINDFDSNSGIGTYIMSDENNGTSAHADYCNNTKNWLLAYQTNSIATGKVIITKFDTINRIISGTFEFNAFIYSHTFIDTSFIYTDTVKLTDGRFDFIY